MEWKAKQWVRLTAYEVKPESRAVVRLRTTGIEAANIKLDNLCLSGCFS